MANENVLGDTTNTWWNRLQNGDEVPLGQLPEKDLVALKKAERDLFIAKQSKMGIMAELREIKAGQEKERVKAEEERVRARKAEKKMQRMLQEADQRLQEFKEELRATKKEVEETKEELQDTKEELRATKKELEETNQRLNKFMVTCNYYDKYILLLAGREILDRLVSIANVEHWRELKKILKAPSEQTKKNLREVWARAKLLKEDTDAGFESLKDFALELISLQGPANFTAHRGVLSETHLQKIACLSGRVEKLNAKIQGAQGKALESLQAELARLEEIMRLSKLLANSKVMQFQKDSDEAPAVVPVLESPPSVNSKPKCKPSSASASPLSPALSRNMSYASAVSGGA